MSDPASVPPRLVHLAAGMPVRVEFPTILSGRGEPYWEFAEWRGVVDGQACVHTSSDRDLTVLFDEVTVVDCSCGAPATAWTAWRDEQLGQTLRAPACVEHAGPPAPGE